MLKAILDNQNDVKKQSDIKMHILEIKSNDDYYLINNLKEL